VVVESEGDSAQAILEVRSVERRRTCARVACPQVYIVPESELVDIKGKHSIAHKFSLLKISCPVKLDI
jgi:hypothetical protein